MLLFALCLFPAHSLTAARAQDSALGAVRKGGVVIYLRTPEAIDGFDDPSAPTGDCGRERNLTKKGRDDAATIGKAFARLGLSFSEIYHGGMCRALETVRALKLPSMGLRDRSLRSNCRQPAAENARLRRRLAGLLTADVRGGTVRLLVSHTCPLFGVQKPLYGTCAYLLGYGTAAVYRPGGDTPQLIGCIGMEDWRKLATD